MSWEFGPINEQTEQHIRDNTSRRDRAFEENPLRASVFGKGGLPWGRGRTPVTQTGQGAFYSHADNVRLRGGEPGTSAHGTILTEIPIGSQLVRTGNEKPSNDGHNWFEVRWGNQTGWVRDDLLGESFPHWIAIRPQTATGREFGDFVYGIGFRESTNNYRRVGTVDPNDHKLGRFQFGRAALIDVGLRDANGNWSQTANEMGIFTDDDYLNNPVAQNYAMEGFLRVNWRYITNAGFHRYVSTYMNGVLITESGLLASTHLMGIGNMRTALRNGDLTSVRDGLGTTPLEYMTRFGGFNVENITQGN